MSEFVPAKFCPGCGYPIALNMLKLVLEKRKITNNSVLGLDIGCNLLAWNYLPMNTFQTHHGRVVPTMTGFKRARPEAVCLALVGDGGAYSIGLQGLMYAAKRDEPITVLVINNTVYGMTGGQSAPTSRRGQITDTHPEGVTEEAWLGPELFKTIVKPGAFVARTAVNDAKQLIDYLGKAIDAQNNSHFSLLEILSLCPTNWKTKGTETIKHLDEKLKPIFKVGIISE